MKHKSKKIEKMLFVFWIFATLIFLVTSVKTFVSKEYLMSFSWLLLSISSFIFAIKNPIRKEK